MTLEAGSPTVRRRRLSAALRHYREATGMTAKDAARQLTETTGDPWSESKMSRIEGAQWKRPSVRDVRSMLDLYDVTDEREREALETLAKEGRQRSWWTAYDDVFSGSLVGFEAEASAIKTFEPLAVPGLLQTAEYARAIFEAVQPPLTPDEIARRVDARMARHQIFERETPPELWVIVEEYALRRPVGGPAVMREQLDHLLAMGRRRQITLQVMEAATGAHCALEGAFLILEFPDAADTPIVHLATTTDGLYLEKPAEIATYSRQFDHVVATALGEARSIDLIRKLRAELS